VPGQLGDEAAGGRGLLLLVAQAAVGLVAARPRLVDAAA
jgi:hypothetical protein